MSVKDIVNISDDSDNEEDENAAAMTSAAAADRVDRGWTLVKGVSVPYVTRNNTKYVSVKMMEEIFLCDFPEHCPHKLLPKLTSYFITLREARYLNSARVVGLEQKLQLVSGTDEIICVDDFMRVLRQLELLFGVPQHPLDSNNNNNNNNNDNLLTTSGSALISLPIHATPDSLVFLATRPNFALTSLETGFNFASTHQSLVSLATSVNSASAQSFAGLKHSGWTSVRTVFAPTAVYLPFVVRGSTTDVFVPLSLLLGTARLPEALLLPSDMVVASCEDCDLLNAMCRQFIAAVYANAIQHDMFPASTVTYLVSLRKLARKRSFRFDELIYLGFDVADLARVAGVKLAASAANEKLRQTSSVTAFQGLPGLLDEAHGDACLPINRAGHLRLGEWERFQQLQMMSSGPRQSVFLPELTGMGQNERHSSFPSQSPSHGWPINYPYSVPTMVMDQRN